MRRYEQPLDGLIVVDARCDDYDGFLRVVDLDAVRVELCSTGEEALRAANLGTFPLWIVNMRLPDMPGIGFLKMVRRRARRSNVFLVGDDYLAADELAARTAGATAYFCKPPSAAWLEGYRLSARTPVIRAPTQDVHESVAALRPP